MKTIKHEIKLEKSVKIIFAILAVGVFLNAFATPIGQELFSIKDAKILGKANALPFKVWQSLVLPFSSLKRNFNRLA